MSDLVAENISKIYGTGDSAVTAVDDITLVVKPGDFVALMGESGAGKSTVLSILGAMNAPTRGRYHVDGIDVYALNQDRRADFRREYLGFVFQSFQLINYLNVLENVMLPLTTIQTGRRQKREMAMNALAHVGLADKARRLPKEISGGEQERVAVARAIVNRPPVLLADEPTGNLDSKTAGEMMELLSRLNQEGTTIVMVTHSFQSAAHARRIVQMVDGALANESRNTAKTGAPPVKAA